MKALKKSKGLALSEKRSDESKGFTLIEMITVIGVFALVLPAIFAIIFSIFRQQAKIYALKQIKREGDQILDRLDLIIRSSDRVCSGTEPSCENQLCLPNQEPILINIGSDGGNGSVRFFTNDSSVKITALDDEGDGVVNGKIEKGETGAEELLHNDNVYLSSFTLTCTPGALTPLVTIDYTINFNTSSTRAEEIGSMNYHTAIRLRNIQ